MSIYLVRTSHIQFNFCYTNYTYEVPDVLYQSIAYISFTRICSKTAVHMNLYFIAASQSLSNICHQVWYSLKYGNIYFSLMYTIWMSHIITSSIHQRILLYYISVIAQAITKLLHSKVLKLTLLPN